MKPRPCRTYRGKMQKPKKFEIRECQVRDVVLGKNVVLMSPLNIYECEIGSDVFIGPFSEIQSNVLVGDRTKVQSHTFICSYVKIGDDCFIGHGVVFTNDLLRDGPAQGDVSKYRATEIGDRVSIGSNSTLLPVKICDDVVIGAGSVVTRDISEPGVYFGNPALMHKGKAC